MFRTIKVLGIPAFFFLAILMLDGFASLLVRSCLSKFQLRGPIAVAKPACPLMGAGRVRIVAQIIV